MSSYASRAAEALEQQVRYHRMLENGDYRRHIQKRHLTQERGEEYGALTTNLMMDMTARVATAKGEPYWWSPEICGMIEKVAAVMPPYTIERETIPGAGGFFWFAKPIFTGASVIKAIAWAFVLPRDYNENDPDPQEQGFPLGALSALEKDRQRAAGISAAFFLADGEYSTITNDPVRRRWEVPQAANIWTFGKSHVEQMKHNLAGMDPEKYDAMPEVRVFAACMAFLRQKILVTKRLQVDRAARKRLAKEAPNHEPFTRIVALRKAFDRLAGAPLDEESQIEWSCHWIVGARDGGFWRNQWIPSENRHELRFILPFIKGDTAKPFKPPRMNVYSVHR